MNCLSIVLQVIAIFTVTLGIYIQVVRGANLGFILITVGAILFGLSQVVTRTKIKRIIQSKLKPINNKKHE